MTEKKTCHRGGGANPLGFLLAAVAALAAAQPAMAEVKDLGGGTTSSSTSNGLTGHTWLNGTLNISANQAFSDNTTTLGAGLTLNQTKGLWGVSGASTLIIRDGAVVNYKSSSVPYFGKRSSENSYAGTTQITFDNGQFTATQTDVKFTAD